FHVANPLDPWGVDDYPEVYPLAIEAAAQEPGDVLIVAQDQQVTAGAYERQLGTDLARYLAAAAAGTVKFPLLLSPTSQDPDPAVVDVCREHNLALARGARVTLAALGKLTSAKPPSPPVRRSPAVIPRLASSDPVTEDVALEVLADAGVDVPRRVRVATADDAAAVAVSLSGPVVVKAVAPGLLHKTDLGLVKVGLYGPDDVRLAAKEILESATAEGIDAQLLVVEQVSASLDVVVGYTRDPQFGPTTLVGLGGVWTEQLDQVSLHVGPLDRATARRVLGESRVGAMLETARGGALDREGVVAVMCAVSDIGIAHPDILAIDVNPVMVSRDRSVAVDAVIQRTTEQGAKQ
ncbi:MAG TPA: acetate--CoA ligase family protein, partial [Actinomycetes bacterium]|nr:acetate--CoA ligase family protein [Actinomycetes bacterium]